MTLLVDDRVGVRSENGLYETYPLVENRGKLNYLYFFEDLPESGFYGIYKNDEYVSTMAWNDNRIESEMSFCGKDDISKTFKEKELNLLATVDYDEINSENMMEVVMRDSAMWKMFIITALILLLIEILVLRFWK